MVKFRSPKSKFRVRFLVPPFSLFTKLKKQDAKKSREEIDEKNEEIKKNLKNLSTGFFLPSKN